MTNHQHNQEENFLFGKDKHLPFAVPQGYFDGLAQRILYKIALQEELKEFSVLSAIQKQNYFAIPENYFLKNEPQFDTQEELAAYTLLSKIPKPVFKPLTEEYANELSKKVFSQFEIADELKAYTTLRTIEKQNVFADVPSGYFDSIADKVKERYYAKVVSHVSLLDQLLTYILKPRMILVCSLVIIIGVSAFIHFNRSSSFPISPVASGDCKTLACLERNELLNDHTMQNLDEENLYDLVDVEQLDEQLSGTIADSLKSNNTDSLPTAPKN